MGGLEIALVAAGLTGVALFASISAHFAQKRTVRPPSTEAPVPELEALLQPRDVPLKVRVLGDAGPSGAATRIVVEGVCDRLVLFLEAPGAPGAPREQAGPLWTTREHELGDPEFDRQFRVLGPQPLALALLDAETRRLLRNLAVHQIAVGRGALRLEVRLSHRRPSRTIEGRGRDAVAVARRLLPQADLAPRLAENARKDPVPAVRLRNLLTVAREHPDHPATRPALKAASADRDPEVRLRAAVALGREGHGVLRAMIEAPATDDAHREPAIRSLGADIPDDVLLRVLRRCAGSGLHPGGPPDQPRSARACVAALGGKRTPEAVSSLQALLLGNPFLAADAAQALGSVGGEDAEAALVGALEGEVFEGRLAAADALGEAGSPAAVPALRAAERQGVEMRRRARQAVAAIQARATAAPGAVSLAGGEAGQVSVVEDASGRVSLPAGARAREGT
jgi:HEAT repeat protein